MKTLNEIADFIENHVIECEPNTGCGKCDEARECLNSLRALANKPYTDVSVSVLRSCPTCRFADRDKDMCTAGTYWAEQGLNRICYEGELWEATER